MRRRRRSDADRHKAPGYRAHAQNRSPKKLAAGKRAYAALREEHITVPFRVRNATFVGEQWCELTRCVKNVGQLLNNPPRVFAAGSIVMVAAADPIHVRGIQCIAPLVKQCAVSAAIHGNLAVAMEFAANDVVGTVGPALYSRMAFAPLTSTLSHVGAEGVLSGWESATTGRTWSPGPRSSSWLQRSLL